MTKISVAVATFNEEKNLGRCLESIYGWVDEIVIVDGSSTDATVKIARKYKAKVEITDNPKIFHINKQKAINLCTGDWILQLDADEVVNNSLKDEIMENVNKQAVNGYWIPRKNFFLGKPLMKGGQYPDYTLRLYRRGKGKLPCQSVHEQASVEGETAYLKNPLFHYPYPDFSHYLEHFNIYTDIFSLELRQNGVKPGILSFFQYFFIKPVFWFFSTYFRHKGFQDGLPGFVFSYFSALRFPVSYVKYWEQTRKL